MDEHTRQPHPKWIFAALAAAGAACLAYWLVSPRAFTADDSVFYQVIARNLAAGNSQTFNGVFPTNGVHPLWLYALTAWHWLLGLFGLPIGSTLALSAPLSFGFLAIGCALLYRSVEGAPATKAAVVGIAALLPALSTSLSSEAHAHFFGLALFYGAIRRGETAGRLQPVALGIAAAVLTYARLDSIFVPAAFYALRFPHREGRKQVLASAGIWIALLLPYLISNQAAFGGMMPISGWLKSTFPLPAFSNLRLVSLNPGGYSLLLGWLPLSAAAALALREIRGAAKPRRISEHPALPFIMGTAAQALYVVLFAVAHTNWHWYYVLPAFALAVASAPLLKRFVGGFPRATVASIVVVVIAAFGARLAVSGVDAGERDLFPTQRAALEYIEASGISDTTIMVSDLPGWLAWLSPANRFIAADFLTGNRKLYRDMKRSSDALEHLRAECDAAGKPLRYLMVFGYGTKAPLDYGAASWLVPSADMRRVDYYDPKLGPARAVIGSLELPVPAAREGSDAGVLVVWGPLE